MKTRWIGLISALTIGLTQPIVSPASTRSDADGWILFGTKADGTEFRWLAKGTKVLGDGHYKVLTRSKYGTPVLTPIVGGKGGLQISASSAEYEILCDARQIQLLSFTYFDAQGKQVEQHSVSRPASAAVAGTVQGELVSSVCMQIRGFYRQ